MCGCSGFPGVHTITAEAEGHGDSHTGAVIYFTGKSHTQVSSTSQVNLRQVSSTSQVNLLGRQWQTFVCIRC